MQALQLPKEARQSLHVLVARLTPDASGLDILFTPVDGTEGKPAFVIRP
jgi:hypothetical protein